MVKEITIDERGTHLLAVEDGELIVGHSQDVEPILEENKRLYNSASESWKGDLHHVATIPSVMVPLFMEEFKCTYHQLVCDPDIRKKLIAKLNSNDYRFLRTKPGKLSCP